jgi:hypothetical protein
LKKYESEIVQSVGISPTVILFIFSLTSYGCSTAHVPIIKPLTANNWAKVLPLLELEWWIAGMVSRWATVEVTFKKANSLCSSYLIGSGFITMSQLDTSTTCSSAACVS